MKAGAASIQRFLNQAAGTQRIRSPEYTESIRLTQLILIIQTQSLVYLGTNG
jgi:hypothetical protein